MRLPIAGLALFAVLSAGSAAAQTTTAPLPAVVTRSTTDPPGGAPDAVGLPMRLSLLSSVSPGAATSGCRDEGADDTGGILPVQPALSVQLTTHLTLQGVSNLGCPGDPYSAFDSGMGGALVYAAPLRRNVSLVAGLGGYGTSMGCWFRPASAGGAIGCGSRRAAGVAGLDVVIQGSSGRTVSVGVGTTSNGHTTRVIPRVSGSF